MILEKTAVLAAIDARLAELDEKVKAGEQQHKDEVARVAALVSRSIDDITQSTATNSAGAVFMAENNDAEPVIWLLDMANLRARQAALQVTRKLYEACPMPSIDIDEAKARDLMTPVGRVGVRHSVRVEIKRKP
jgi:hypothetical protein